MKLFGLTLLLFCCSTLFAQRTTLTGNVVEVLNGDTMAIEDARKTRFVVKLQFVDAPESSQPLYQLVKDHLSNFVLNKHVTFELKTLSRGVSRCKVLLNGKDLSLQMLRDGAVWYDLPDGDSQPPAEKHIYLEHEQQAKAEKRGVWGVPSIRPAYELRLAREKAEKERLDKAWKEFVESAFARAKYDAPAVGMHYFSFKQLCKPMSESGDYNSTRDSTYGTTIYESLAVTDARKKNGCWGDFHFDESFRLTSMSQSSKVK